MLRGDCRDEEVIKPLLAKADAIITLAAIVGAPLCNQDKVAAQTINQGAIEMICKLASPAQRILVPVTNSGYGIGEKGKYCTEDSPLRPISLYGVTKVKAEEAVLARDNSISFRLATVFGMSPRMRIDLLVNDFVYRAVHDRAAVIAEADLAAGRSRQELAETDEIGIGVLVDPLSPHDELVAKISDVSDRAAETGQPELEKYPQHLDRRAGRWPTIDGAAALRAVVVHDADLGS